MAGQDPTGTQIGDKVRIRRGANAGERAIVEEIFDSSVRVRLEGGESVLSPSDTVTNYSLAARRAWDVMPKRAGRPTSAGAQKKMVSIRLDSQVWELLGRAVELGLIPSREQAINTWLRQRADELLEKEAAREQQVAEGSNA